MNLVETIIWNNDNLLRRYISSQMDWVEENKFRVRNFNTKTPPFASASEEEKEDILFCFSKFGINDVEYYKYDFPNKDMDERQNFVSMRAQEETFLDMTTEEQRDIINDKYRTFCRLSSFYGRDVVGQGNREGFIRFCETHDEFVMKPAVGACGKGIMFIDLKERGLTPERYYDRYLDGKDFIIEEVIRQDSRMAKFHPESVNTVRPVTYYDGKEVRLLFAIMRTGVGDNRVDNTSAGGLAIRVSEKDGSLMTGGVTYMNGRILKAHPDTGLVFREEAVPCWNELLEVSEKAAIHLGFKAIIGWDMALTDDGWVIVEANWMPGLSGVQGTMKKGIRPVLEKRTGKSFVYKPRILSLKKEAAVYSFHKRR